MDKAYTLLEVVITLFLIGLSLLLSIPCFSHLFHQKNNNKVMHQIIGLLENARSEAIKRGHNVVICASQDGLHCGRSWTEGQIILDKENGEIIMVYPPLPAGSILLWRNSFGRNNELVFSSLGFANGQKGSFLYRSADGAYFNIAIERTGRWRILD